MGSLRIGVLASVVAGGCGSVPPQAVGDDAGSGGGEDGSSTAVVGATTGPGDDDGATPSSGTSGMIDADGTSSGGPGSQDASTSSPGSTGEDSGAGCATHEACGTAMICDGECRLPLHCAELLGAWPGTSSGEFSIDPDGDGVAMAVACDMDHDGGGWTRVLLEDFEDSDGAAWSTAVVSTCGNLGEMLGGSGNFAGGTVQRDVDLFGIVHAQARLLARFIKIDSWDQEIGYAQIDGIEVWSLQCNFDRCGPDSQCGTSYPDGEHPVDGTTAHAEAAMTLAFGSTLNQPATNEAWGVDDVEIWLR